MRGVVKGVIATGMFLSLLVTVGWAKGPNYLRLSSQAAIPTLDPGLSEASISIQVIEQLFLGLTDYDPKTFEVAPELAESWTSNEDSTVYTFKLRQDVKWTDGKPVTAHDIVYALRRNVDPKTVSPYASTLHFIKNAADILENKMAPDQLAVKALDDYTVEFTLNTPAGFFPAVAGLWSYRPVRQDIIEKYGDRWTEPANIVTNGSYRLTEWKKGDRIVLKANPDYFSEVGIPEVHYYIIPEMATALAMFENDELDLLNNDHTPVPDPDLERLRNDSQLSKELSFQKSLCNYYIAFNNQKPPVDNHLVRKAIVAAIDRKAIAERILKNGWQPATTHTPPPIFGNVADEGIGIKYDPAQAKKWLAEAGYPDGKGFPEITYMYNTHDQHSKIAQAMQALLRRNLGINIRLANQEWKVFIQTRKSPDAPHMTRYAWCADYMDAHNFLFDVLHPTKSENEIKWNNQEFADLIEKAVISSDPVERKKLYREAEIILNEKETAVGMLFYYADPTLVKSRVTQWAKMPLGGNQLRNWRLAP